MKITNQIKFLVIIFLLASVQTVVASEFTVRPFLIDETVQPNEVLQETITLTNDSSTRKYVVFATVNEISVDNEGIIKEFSTPSMTDRTVSPTSWVEISRGRFEIPPNEKLDVPLTLRINPNAIPGEYHVFLGLVPAPNRPAAEAIAMNGQADGVILKITVADTRKDNMKINSFLVDRFVTGDDDRLIEIEIENVGDLVTKPKGEIIFYNSRGAEVDSINVNFEGQTVEPGKTLILTNIIPLENKLGRFKANLALRYGNGEASTLFDTTFFYMMPLHLLLIVFGGILVIAIVIAFLIKRVLVHQDYSDDGEEVIMYVRDGHDANPQDHDIDLKTKK
jgi:hypothetical protein